MIAALHFCTSDQTTEQCITEMPVEFSEAIFNIFKYVILITLVLFLAGRLADFTGGCFCCKKKSVKNSKNKVIFKT